MGQDTPSTFPGFDRDTFGFFIALSMNNNRTFFHENHDWYVRSVRTPALLLARQLAPTALCLSPELDTRPDKVVSRINRDLRFSADKTPYRTHIWLSFRRAGARQGSALCAYFSLSLEGASYGFGLYDENRPLLNGLRTQLRLQPDGFLQLLAPLSGYEIHVNAFKKIPPLPEGLDERLHTWYRARSFYIERSITDFTLIGSPALAQEVANGYTELMHLFRYFDAIIPEEEMR